MATTFACAAPSFYTSGGSGELNRSIPVSLAATAVAVAVSKTETIDFSSSTGNQSRVHLICRRRSSPGCSDCTGGTTPCGQVVGAVLDEGVYVGIFDVFKIGVGPSSSHTMGPMWAGKKFVQRLFEASRLGLVVRIQVDLFGSLASTGKGHATDKAVVLGLCGYQPDTIDPDAASDTFSNVCQSGEMYLNGLHRVLFDIESDVRFHMDIELPLHPNAMRIRALGGEAGLEPSTVDVETYYSIGGGFINTEAEMLKSKELQAGVADEEEDEDEESSPEGLLGSPLAGCSGGALTPVTAGCGTGNAPSSPPSPSHLSFYFSSAEQLVAMSEEKNMSIAEIMVANECAHKNMTKEEVYRRLDEIAEVIEACVSRGLRMEGRMPVSNIPRRAVRIRQRLQQNAEKSLGDPLAAADWIALYARAVNEENACGGRVVTAPTNGAAGTLPAVLTYYRRSIPTASRQGVREFLAVAAAIGSLCKRNASISGAEAGCQAEVGSACAMAAAGLAAVLGGSSSQIENAAEIGLEHCLGLTCDPIMGLVQIPCIERNCVASVKAVMACRLALVGDGVHEVSLDSCIETMYRTGLDMQSKYKETSRGGLAVCAKRPARLRSLGFSSLAYEDTVSTATR